MKRLLTFGLSGLALIVQPAHAQCVCNTAPLEAMVAYVTNPTLDSMNGKLWTITQQLEQYFDDQPGGNVHGQLQQIQRETSQNRAAIMQQTKQDETLAGYQVRETRDTVVKQTLADNDAHAAIAVQGSRAPGACSNGINASAVGAGTSRQASASSAMNDRVRLTFGGVNNPVDEVDRILAMGDAERIPEFIGSDAGTLTDAQVEQYMSALSVLMPTPPRSPVALPAGVKNRPLAAEYEMIFRKAEAAQVFLGKPFVREATMMYPSIEATGSMREIWDQIVGAVGAAGLVETAEGGLSSFPDHWGALNVVESAGRSYISERDFIRTEVFKRYANPHYQSDPRYGLASMGTEEALMKELIFVVNLQNRMVYEIMNSDLHAKQYLALLAAGPTLDGYKQDLMGIEARLAAD